MTGEQSGESFLSPRGFNTNSLEAFSNYSPRRGIPFQRNVIKYYLVVGESEDRRGVFALGLGPRNNIFHIDNNMNQYARRFMYPQGLQLAVFRTMSALLAKSAPAVGVGAKMESLAGGIENWVRGSFTPRVRRARTLWVEGLYGKRFYVRKNFIMVQQSPSRFDSIAMVLIESSSELPTYSSLCFHRRSRVDLSCVQKTQSFSGSVKTFC